MSIHESHGDHKARLYRIWADIKQRTSNPNLHNWSHYGGRGITMYPEWFVSYTAFKRDVIGGYRDGLTIDRIDNDGNYEPGNVQWATKIQQSANQRHLRSTNTSGYRGVRSHKKRWQARIKVDGRDITIGTYDTKEEAALAYNTAAVQYRGEYASLNVV